MKTFFDRKRILSLVFFLYFSVYAASPLFSFSEGQMQLRGPDDPGFPSAYSKNFHIYLYDLLCSNLFRKNKADFPRSASGVILLKKRAVLSDETAKLIRLSDVLSQNNSPLFICDDAETQLLSLPRAVNKTVFLNRYFGLSPPQAA